MRLKPPDLTGFTRAKQSAPALGHFGTSKSAEQVKTILSPKVPLNPGHINNNRLKLTAQRPEHISQQIRTLIQSLGLPQDSLSSSIISFFKFFSLPLEAPVLKNIRREILGTKTARESTALGAGAAFDKGVRLDSQALEEYAAAIDPASRDSTPGDGSSGNGNPPAGNGSGGSGGGENPGDDAPGAGDIKNLMEEIDQENGLLSCLNRIPGKNGQYWIILPFNFTSGAIEFSVSVRILIYTINSQKSAERLAVDAVAGDRRWLFVLTKSKDAAYEMMAGLSPSPGKAQLSAWADELKELFGGFISKIGFINENEIDSYLDSKDNSIIFVDEEV